MSKTYSDDGFSVAQQRMRRAVRSDPRNPRPPMKAWQQKMMTDLAYVQPEVEVADVAPGVVMLMHRDRVGELTRELGKAFADVSTQIAGISALDAAKAMKATITHLGGERIDVTADRLEKEVDAVRAPMKVTGNMLNGMADALEKWGK